MWSSVCTLPISYGASYGVNTRWLALTAPQNGSPTLRNNQSVQRLVGRGPPGRRNSFAQFNISHGTFVPEQTAFSLFICTLSTLTTFPLRMPGGGKGGSQCHRVPTGPFVNNPKLSSISFFIVWPRRSFGMSSKGHFGKICHSSDTEYVFGHG